MPLSFFINEFFGSASRESLQEGLDQGVEGWLGGEEALQEGAVYEGFCVFLVKKEGVAVGGGYVGGGGAEEVALYGAVLGGVVGLRGQLEALGFTVIACEGLDGDGAFLLEPLVLPLKGAQTFLNECVFEADIISGKLLPEVVDYHHRFLLPFHSFASKQAKQFRIELV